jgi:hypothetical protein
MSRFRPRKPKEVNTKKCHVCGAEKGDTCFVLTRNSFQELNRTHRTTARLQAQAIREEQDRPMFLDRTL